MTGFRAAIDIGGTYTDIVVAGGGVVYRSKLPSTPDDYARAVIDGLLALLARHRIAPAALEAVLHGTTIATNTILQETGARVGLLTTRGFRDVLEIARLRRASLYDLAWRPPRPLVRRAWRLELGERIDAQGNVLQPLDRDEIKRQLERLRADGIDALAVALLNAHVNPRHEAAIARLVRETHPDLPVSLSSELSPVIREYERTSTAVVNAYLQPTIGRYLERLGSGLRAAGIGCPLGIMQSNGGIVGVPEACRAPVLLVESGPAAGIRAVEAWAAHADDPNVIAVDVGGTTAKAALIEDGRAGVAATLEVCGGMSSGGRLLRGVGYPVNVPSYELAEVSAGGGSVAWVDQGGALRVGPRSAGACPGPACYGLGGTEPTLTDAYLVLGWISPHGIGGRRLNIALAERAIAERVAQPLRLSVEDAAIGICDLAKASMVGALKAVSAERGRNPGDFSLVAFGGGGPIVAHALAEALGTRRAVVPTTAGLYSAVGMLLADAKRTASASLLRPLDRLEPGGLDAAFAVVEERVRAMMTADGVPPHALHLERTAELHYDGQDFELAVTVPNAPLGSRAMDDLAERFARQHERVFGHRNPGERIVAVNLRVQGTATVSPLAYRDLAEGAADAGAALAHRRAYFGPGYGFRDTAVARGRSAVRDALHGPAIIEEEHTTILVPPGWHARLDPAMSVVLARSAEATEGRATAPRQSDAVALEVIRLALLAIAEEMALALVRSAYSVGIRDIMDFGTALCDGAGRLVAQAQTLAIHLGAVPPAVEAVRERFGGNLQSGDVIILNDPYRGGMHLADIFMVQPIFGAEHLVAYAVVVAHQVDMGGSVPGGNAASLKSIYEEGLRIPPMRLVQRGALNDTLLAMIQRNVRTPREVAGDLRSMLGACDTAARAIAKLVVRHERATLARAMDEMRAHAERLARAEIRRLPAGRFTFEDFMDDDGVSDAPVRIAVACTIGDGKVGFDFSGSSSQVRGACNATLSVARSAAYFALRCAMRADVPVNAGYYQLVEVAAPEGSVVNPRFPASCAAKGVTAFRVCDAILGALGRVLPDRMPAAGEGGATVITFSGPSGSGEPFVLMDLVLGAMGGGPACDGIEGIANPSCNVRNTPVEIIEARYPLRIERYGFVADSGGAGEFRGGLAICRSYRFLADSGILQVRSDRRNHPPFGAAGGSPGAPSANILVRDGKEEDLPPKFVIPLRKGDVFQHVHAGGGGYGPAAKRAPERIRTDLADEKITEPVARRAYGWTR